MSEFKNDIEEQEVTEEKNEQECVNKKSKMKIFKNEKTRKILKQSMGFIIGFIIGVFFIGICFTSQAIDDEETIKQKEAQIDEQASQIGELENKVSQAEPWFKMNEEEQRKIEEQNAKVEAEKKAATEKKAEEERIAAEKKAEEEKLAAEEAEKNKYNTDLTYNQIARNPEDTLFKNCKFNGEVVQVIEGDDSNNLRVAINGDYDKMMLVEYDPKILDSRILENDNVTLYGSSLGTTSYESTMGATITIPSMLADKIDMN